MPDTKVVTPTVRLILKGSSFFLFCFSVSSHFSFFNKGLLLEEMRNKLESKMKTMIFEEKISESNQTPQNISELKT